MLARDHGLISELRHRMGGNSLAPRIERIDLEGQTYWVKRPEALSFIWRLRKGNPKKALQREIEGYTSLQQRGLAVAPLVDSGDDYFITANSGTSIAALFHDQLGSDEERGRALMTAARALQAIHAEGLAHGRPNLKDMLWDGKKVYFIDLERFGVIKTPLIAQTLDLLMFAMSCFAIRNSAPAQIAEALRCYRDLDQRGIWTSALRLLRCAKPLDLALLPLLRTSRRMRDVRAFHAMLQFFFDLDKAAARPFKPSA